MDLDEARSRAKTLKAQITLGSDPRGEAAARKAVLTFDEFFQDHYMPHAKVHKRSLEGRPGLVWIATQEGLRSQKAEPDRKAGDSIVPCFTTE